MRHLSLASLALVLPLFTGCSVEVTTSEAHAAEVDTTKTDDELKSEAAGLDKEELEALIEKYQAEASKAAEAVADAVGDLDPGALAEAAGDDLHAKLLGQIEILKAELAKK